ncbi:hypothetical protein JTB14_027135 [Gonioctena quinquepunctata]|nr:hypothetical protein JTB14_027135 [Gonioctena quinquepunctata]
MLLQDGTSADEQQIPQNHILEVQPCSSKTILPEEQNNILDEQPCSSKTITCYFLTIRTFATSPRDIRPLPKKKVYTIKKKKYDVVQVIENKKLGDVSVIPTNWLSNNSKIHNFYNSYAKALEHEKKLAASSESEGDQEQQAGKPRIKKITAEYESIVNPPSVCSKLFSEDKLRAGGDIPFIEDPHDTTDVSIVENLPVVVPANQISDIMEMVADIRSMCQITLNKVNSIVEHSVDKSRNIDTTDDVIKECLPLKTIDGLLNLEDLLNNNKIAASQFWEEKNKKNKTQSTVRDVVVDETNSMERRIQKKPSRKSKKQEVTTSSEGSSSEGDNENPECLYCSDHAVGGWIPC